MAMMSTADIAFSEIPDVDPTVWRACAGTAVQVPAVGSRVYYFPQGHAEQSSSPPFFSPLFSSQPFILCCVLSVKFLANPVTDEVFAAIRLAPIARGSHAPWPSEGFVGNEVEAAEGSEEEEKVVSFAKILTPSDANNGGGFSVPRYCADSIFPALDYAAEPPVQNIMVRDIHGMVWEFRHIYRGTPRRHLLTTGWSKFVNYKKLVAGDSVVFIRNRKSGELFVGLRRAVRMNADSGGRWNCPVGSMKVKAEEGGGVCGGREGFSRNGKGRVSAESVAEAAEMAAKGMAFEVVYYPRASCADFVVKAETVEESLNVFWQAGMRIKMATETEDSSRMAWFQGAVSSALVPENGQWRGSPWRMLQIKWDEPEVLQNMKRVNPWQVEYLVPTAPPFHSSIPPAKKFKVPPNSGVPSDGEGELYFPMTNLSNSMTGHLKPSLMNHSSFPAGMQGARQEQICVSSLSNLTTGNKLPIYKDDFVGNMAPVLKPVSTELNIGSSQSENLSPDSQSSVHFFGNDVFGKQAHNCSASAGANSFQLFGKTIHMKEPSESGFDDAGRAEEGNKVYKETDGVKNPPDLSLNYPYAKWFDGLDVQCPRASAVEACYL